jgi:ubiquinol-cytochrome c reductase cytochrome b subunit
LVDYPTPSNLTYYWGFGSLAGRILVVQLRTGVFLAIHYTPHVTLAFASVEHIMRDVSYGWRRRYRHANGASFFFVVVYLHMMRGRYYGSYASPREHLWGSGVILFLRIMGTGFIGYVLPFGQMSLWGATVITNLASAIPRVGQGLVEWLWGGFSVDNATLNRFFSLHYRLPFVIAARALVHLVRLHGEGVGSGNPIGVDGDRERTPFYPYFYVKDRLGFRGRMRRYSRFVFFAPNALGHPDNYIIANAMVTPPHIVPEWYFLIFYAILRSIPHKLIGVVAMLAAIRRRRARPYRNTSEVRSSRFRPIFRQCYWRFVVTCMILGWIGQKVVEYPYIQVGQLGSRYYFRFRVRRIPIVGRRESLRIEVGSRMKSE